MAKASAGSTYSDLKTFTDCMYFLNGHCKLNDKCRYRHCREAAAQTNHCFKWPRTCRDIKCPYRHPAPPHIADEKKKRSTSESIRVDHTPARPPTRQEGLISFFWDIENVPIPRAQKPFDIVQRIRQKLLVNTGLREYNFTCYCNSTTISQENQLNLFHANVRIVHVPDRKPGAVDRQIMLELDRFERAHRPPATIVLISGDIDFVGKLSDLRHQAGFHVIVIHNKPAKAELKATVNAHYPWESFTQTPVEASGLSSSISELSIRMPQPYRMKDAKNDGHLQPVKSSSPPRATPLTRKPTHRCPKCMSEFNSIQALRQHQDTKDHLFDCPLCDECFPTLDGQIQHQKAKSHYAAEYVCLQCNRRFTNSDSLNQHQQATGHNGFAIPATPGSNEFFRRRSPPKTHQTNGDAGQDAIALVIQHGIQALAQHLPHILAKKK